MKNKSILYGIIVFLLILLWGYGAASKLFTYEVFRFQLLGHKVLVDYAGMVAWFIPAIELVIAILLLIPRTRLCGLYASAGLLVLFTGYIIYMFNFYPATPCSCSGFIGQLGWREHIVFNLAFLAIAITGIWLQVRYRTALSIRKRFTCL